MLATDSTTTGKPPAAGGVLNFGWDNNNKWAAQLAIRINSTPHLYLRGNNNSDWDASWLTVLDSNNFNTYAPKKDGTGATGTWGISISGSATKATQDSDGNAINTTYLKRSGGTMTGAINFPYNKQSISFRHDNASYDSGFVYGTSGNEALALV